MLRDKIIRKLECVAGSLEAASEYLARERQYRLADENKIAARSYRRAAQAVVEAFDQVEKSTTAKSGKKSEVTC